MSRDNRPRYWDGSLRPVSDRHFPVRNRRDHRDRRDGSMFAKRQAYMDRYQNPEDKDSQRRKLRERKRILKRDIIAKMKFPPKNWAIRDFNEKFNLLILRDTIHNSKHGIVPTEYKFSKFPIIDSETLNVVCHPINITPVFVVPRLPLIPSGMSMQLIAPNEDVDGVTFGANERESTMNLDYQKCNLQYCYEGKYCRAYRYRGNTHISFLNRITMENCKENTIRFCDVYESTEVDMKSLFDESAPFCKSIVHFLIGFPNCMVRTRRRFSKPYIVILSLEKMYLVRCLEEACTPRLLQRGTGIESG